MTRKRFEKLLIAKHKSQARDVRKSTRVLIEMRHYSERNKGFLMIYDKENNCYTELKLRPYSEMLARIERGEKALG